MSAYTLQASTRLQRSWARRPPRTRDGRTWSPTRRRDRHGGPSRGTQPPERQRVPPSGDNGTRTVDETHRGGRRDCAAAGVLAPEQLSSRTSRRSRTDARGSESARCALSSHQGRARASLGRPAPVRTVTYRLGGKRLRVARRRRSAPDRDEGPDEARAHTLKRREAPHRHDPDAHAAPEPEGRMIGEGPEPGRGSSGATARRDRH